MCESCGCEEKKELKGKGLTAEDAERLGNDLHEVFQLLDPNTHVDSRVLDRITEIEVELHVAANGEPE